MTVVNPNNTTHTISVVPRFDVEPVTEEVQEDFLTVVITDSFKDVSNSLDNTFDVLNGKLIITFDYDFRSESRYDVVINYVNTSEVIYRGIFIATTQGTQDYKLTNDKYYY